VGVKETLVLRKKHTKQNKDTKQTKMRRDVFISKNSKHVNVPRHNADH